MLLMHEDTQADTCLVSPKHPLDSHTQAMLATVGWAGLNQGTYQEYDDKKHYLLENIGNIKTYVYFFLNSHS